MVDMKIKIFVVLLISIVNSYSQESIEDFTHTYEGDYLVEFQFEYQLPDSTEKIVVALTERDRIMKMIDKIEMEN